MFPPNQTVGGQQRGRIIRMWNLVGPTLDFDVDITFWTAKKMEFLQEGVKRGHRINSIGIKIQKK